MIAKEPLIVRPRGTRSAPGTAMHRIFILSPAHCAGRRAQYIRNPDADFALAARMRSAAGAPLGDVFSFLSGLYFRGKLAYARAFANPPAGVDGVVVIPPTEGLRPVH